MGFTVLAMATLAVVFAAIIIALVIHQIYSNVAEKKRQAALEYLLKATERVYFYGQSVARCLEKGVVWNLSLEELGDFAWPMGCVVLYALGAKGSGNAQICWTESYDRERERCYYAAYVVFDYCGWRWMLDLRSPGLDRSGFKRYKDSMDLDYAGYGYWDISRRERCLAENCTDPERSNLAPDFRYREMGLAEFEQETKHLVEFYVI